MHLHTSTSENKRIHASGLLGDARFGEINEDWIDRSSARTIRSARWPRTTKAEGGPFSLTARSCPMRLGRIHF